VRVRSRHLGIAGLLALATGAGVIALVLRTSSDPRLRAPSAIDPAPPVVAAPTASVHGRVLRDLRPAVARVDLRLVQRSEDEGGDDPWPTSPEALALRTATPLATSRTGDDGGYVFEDLDAGWYVLTATADDGSADDAQPNLRVRGQELEMDLVLRPHAETVRGRVLGPDGLPVRADVFALVVQGENERDALWGPAPTKSGDDGRFEVGGLSGGRVRLHALDASGRAASSEPIPLPLAGEVEMRFEAEAASAEVSGRVVSARDGAPVPAAVLTSGVSWQEPRTVRARSMADRDGRFRHRLPPGCARVRVEAPGFLPAVLRAPAFDETVRLEVAARIEGRVRLRDGGAAPPGVRVHLARNEGWRDNVATPGAEGRYVFEGLSADRYAVCARGGGVISDDFLAPVDRLHDEYPLALAAGATLRADLVLVPAASVAGRLVDAGGMPVRGVLVTVSRAPTQEKAVAQRVFAYSLDWTGFLEAGTARDGSFRLDSLVPGVAYEVEAAHGRGPFPEIAHVVAGTPEAERVELRQPSPRWIDVRVVDQTSGQPIAFAHVSAHRLLAASDGSDDDGWGGPMRPFSLEASAETGPDGAVRLGPVGPGMVSIGVDAEGYASPSPSPGIGPDTASPAAVTVRLARTRAITGRVLLPDGRLAAGARVVLRHSGSTSSERTVGKDATFRFLDVRPDPGSLHASLTLEREYEASAPASGEAVDLVLAPVPDTESSRVFVRVLDPFGKPVPRAHSLLRTGRSSDAGSVWDGHVVLDRGKAHWRAGEPWTIEVTDPRTETGAPLTYGRVEITRTDAHPFVEIRLTPAHALEGRVLAPDGRPVVGARVCARPVAALEPRPEWRLGSYAWRKARVVRTDDSGKFRLEGLGAGEHQVYVLPPAPWAIPDPVAVSVDTPDLVIRLRHGIDATLTLTDPAGTPVRGARVLVRRLGFRGEEHVIPHLFWGMADVYEVTGEDGVVRLVGLDPTQTLVLGVDPAGTGLADHVDLAWKPADARIRLLKERAVEGVVRDENGRPVHKASVMYVHAGGVTDSVDTDESGAFRVGGLAAGPVQLRAVRYGTAALPTTRTSDWTTVDAGTTNVSLTLIR
jgi:hypothetical protein